MKAVTLAVYTQSLQGVSWNSHEQGIWHILSLLLCKTGPPAAWQTAWWHRSSRACSGMGDPVQHTFTGSHSDPAPTGLIWRAASGSSSAGNPGAPGVSSQLVYPHLSAALAATTHIRQELHPSVLMTRSLFYVKSSKWLSSSMLIILSFRY